MADRSDFVTLYIPIQGDLLAYILCRGVPPSDADDVLQESAMAIFRKIGAFEKGTNFRAWAYSIVGYEILQYFRQEKKASLVLSAEAVEDIDYLARDDAQVPGISLEALNVCLDKLGTKSKSLVTMRYNQGLSLKDISGRLGRTVDSIYVSMSRIRQFLNDCIERYRMTEKTSDA